MRCVNHYYEHDVGVIDMTALFLPIFDKEKNTYFDSGYLSFLVSESSKLYALNQKLQQV
jgi:hypothetical protein